MGRKLDALLRRNSKLKTLLNLAISRLAILKNNRHARFTIARSDVIQLLRLNHHQQALLRVEQVIKDQSMLVVYDMIHEYCNLLKQKVNHIEQESDCPDELKGAVSSLLYAAPRCGEFPELQEIRAILTARFGKEFVNSQVSQKMIQKLSSKELSLESRTMTLASIAREEGIVLQLEAMVLPKKTEKGFDGAAYAAAAAKVAMEPGVSELFNSDGPESPDSRVKNVLDSEPVKSKLQMSDSSSKCDSESDYDEIIEEEAERSDDNMEVEEFADLYSDYYSDDDDIRLKKEQTEFPSRTLHLSSYKPFPFRNQANTKTEWVG